MLAVGTERARELRFYSVNHKTPPVLKKAFPTQHPEPIIGLALPSFPALPASAFAVSVCSAMRDRTVKFWSPRGHALAALKTDVGAHAALVASQPARFVGVVGVSSKQAHIMSVHQTAQGKFEKAMHSMTLSGHRVRGKQVCLCTTQQCALLCSNNQRCTGAAGGLGHWQARGHDGHGL